MHYVLRGSKAALILYLFGMAFACMLFAVGGASAILPLGVVIMCLTISFPAVVAGFRVQMAAGVFAAAALTVSITALYFTLVQAGGLLAAYKIKGGWVMQLVG